MAKNLPRDHQRFDIARGVLNDVAALLPLIDAVPNIIGPAYGAEWCDRALKVIRAVEYLLAGIELALPVADAGEGDGAWKTIPNRLRDARAILRERAGEPPLPGEVYRNGLPRRRTSPLTDREHICLGTDLCRLRDGLQTAYITLANTYGVTHDLPRRARKASTALLKLRDKLDSQAHQECPAHVEGRSTSSIYFGSAKVA